MATILTLDPTDLPTDGDVLVYDAATQKWLPEAPATGGGGAVDSVNGQAGAVVLDAADVGAATAAQGELADTAVQPATLSAYATSSDLTTGLAAKADAAVSISAQTGAYSLVVADAGKAVEVTSATPVTVTVPTNATAAIPVGSVIEVYQGGAGQVSIAAAVGVTINSRGALLGLAGQYAVVSLRKRATDEWVLAGDVA